VMRIILYALTGMGNDVLGSMLNVVPAQNILVMSRKEVGAYPYYDEKYLFDICRKHQVRCELDVDSVDGRESLFVNEFNPDVLICATYHRKIPAEIRSVPRLGCFNIHSSLLPFYRGATPTAWTILNGEEYSGITIHSLTDAIDGGDIFHQCAIPVGNKNDGELRRALSRLAAREISNFLRSLATKSCAGIPQKPGSGSSQPHILSLAGRELVRTGKFDPENIKRAFSPYPGEEAAYEFLC